jgi:hypothetical protein
MHALSRAPPHPALHAGADIHWAGYYDQYHFANDFQAFSGLSPTHYSAANRPWANHIPLA